MRKTNSAVFASLLATLFSDGKNDESANLPRQARDKLEEIHLLKRVSFVQAADSSSGGGGDGFAPLVFGACAVHLGHNIVVGMPLHSRGVFIKK